MRRILFKSVNLLGDGLYVGPVAKAWTQRMGKVDDEVHLLTIENHARAIYDGMGIDWKVIYEKEGEYDIEIDFNVSKAFEISDKKKCHLVNSYAELAGISNEGLIAKPNYQPPYMDIPDDRKGLVLVSMYSMSCASRENPPKPPNKMLPWMKWKPLLNTLRKEYPNNPIRLLGAKEDRVPKEFEDQLGITDEHYLTGVKIPELANIMKHAVCLVTVDNGMGHLAASQDLNEFLLVPAVLSMHYIVPWGHKGLRPVHVNPVTVNPQNINWHLISAIQDWKEMQL